MARQSKNPQSKNPWQRKTYMEKKEIVELALLHDSPEIIDILYKRHPELRSDDPTADRKLINDAIKKYYPRWATCSQKWKDEFNELQRTFQEEHTPRLNRAAYSAITGILRGFDKAKATDIESSLDLLNEARARGENVDQLIKLQDRINGKPGHERSDGDDAQKESEQQGISERVMEAIKNPPVEELE